MHADVNHCVLSLVIREGDYMKNHSIITVQGYGGGGRRNFHCPALSQLIIYLVSDFRSEYLASPNIAYIFLSQILLLCSTMCACRFAHDPNSCNL